MALYILTCDKCGTVKKKLLSNAEEASRLLAPDTQEKVAGAMAEAILEFLHGATAGAVGTSGPTP